MQFAGLEHLKQIKVGKYIKENLMLVDMNKAMVIFQKIIEITLWPSNFIHLIRFVRCPRGTEHCIGS